MRITKNIEESAQRAGWLAARGGWNASAKEIANDWADDRLPGDPNDLSDRQWRKILRAIERGVGEWREYEALRLRMNR